MIPLAFEEVELSRDYTAVAKGGPKFKTGIIGNDQAVQQRAITRYDAIRQWEIQFGGLSPAQLTDMEEFFLTKFGMAIGFRFFSPTDNEFKNDVVATVAGGELNFRLWRVYQGGTVIFKRRIVKPIAGEVGIFVDGVAIAFNMDWNTGIFTFPGGNPAVGKQVKAQGFFNVPVVFGSDFFNPETDTTFSDWNSVPITEVLPITLGLE
jgi:uncharacterized protein (TIGR02217 family)